MIMMRESEAVVVTCAGCHPAARTTNSNAWVQEDIPNVDCCYYSFISKTPDMFFWWRHHLLVSIAMPQAASVLALALLVVLVVCAVVMRMCQTKTGCND